MAEVPLPRYMRPKKVRRGGLAYYWEPPHWARNGALRNGRVCPAVATALGPDLAGAIRRAEVLNEGLDAWRTDDVVAEPSIGTIKGLFAWYQHTTKFKRLSPKTRADYSKLMRAIADLRMKNGTLGQRHAAKVDAEAADKIYERFRERGERQATYAMQVCRLVWNWAGRYPKVTGINKVDNPFAGMALNHRVAQGNRAATRDEYNKYRETARELGFQSMASAAALAFELVQRVSDVFGFEDSADADAPHVTSESDRGIRWEDYRPGQSITVRQHKTGKQLVIPLTVPGIDPLALYPELEEELSRLHQGTTGLIITEERNGRPYKHRRMSQVHRQICEAGQLPKNLTFTGFRHGGATELGDSGEADIRSISGHTQINTSLLYNKASQEKARGMALRRREHIKLIAGKSDDSDA